MSERVLDRKAAGAERTASGHGQVLVVVETARDPDALIAHAAAIARATGRRVRLIERLARVAPPDAPVDPVEQDLRRRAAEARLGGIAAAHARDRQAPSCRVYEHLVPQSVSDPGEPAPFIALHARQGELPWQHDGETRRFVERHCRAVLVVPPSAPERRTVRYRRVMLLLDGSRRAEQALSVSATVARRHGAELLLVHASPEPALLASEPLEPEALELRRRLGECNRRAAGAYLDRLRARTSGAGLALATRLLGGQDPRRGLIEAMSRDAADLVVIASHGESGHADVATGSVAHHLLGHAPVPVLMLASMVDPTAASLYDSPDSHHLRRAGEAPAER